jgi:hypothetical protein
VRKNRIGGLLAGAVLAGGLFGAGDPASAEFLLEGVKVEYHGGALIQHVKVVPLLYGSSWTGKTAPDYLRGFLQALFTDGRYLANLGQFSAGGFHIGNGSAVDPVVDPAVLGKVDADHALAGVRYQVTDEQLQTEIKAQITAGKLPRPDDDTVYVVCVAPDVVVINGYEDSESSFNGYHDYDTEVGAAYAVIAPTGASLTRVMNSPTGYHNTIFNWALTIFISHEVAEAVTDPDGDGWIDENKLLGGEIADIPIALNLLGFITDDQTYDLLTGADGTVYVVQKVWSNRDKAPVAFAPVPPA